MDALSREIDHAADDAKIRMHSGIDRITAEVVL
jgi:hypothetical protein